jgi:hypothetical protein
VAALVLASADVARAATQRTTVAQKRFLKKLRTADGGIPFVPPASLDPNVVKAVDNQVAKYGKKIPKIPAVVRNATPQQINQRQRFLLERYRQIAVTRPNNTAFGGVYPNGATVYFPTQPINIVTYFPVFRI